VNDNFLNGPKQPGQDAEAHRQLAMRHLEALQEIKALKAAHASLKDAATALVVEAKFASAMFAEMSRSGPAAADRINDALAAVEREIGGA
jgi:hypothetical protein